MYVLIKWDDSPYVVIKNKFVRKNILILCMHGVSVLTVNGQTLLKGVKFTNK